MRTAGSKRKTAETKIELELNLDGGEVRINSGNGFFDHMLTLFAHHGRLGLILDCQGDIMVDFHHSCEDIGIVLGRALRQALGEARGVNRYGWIILPMDEALVLASVDISGRGLLGFKVEIPTERIGGFESELVKEFWLAFSREAGLTLHLQLLSGENSHHIIEAVFKAAGRAIGMAAAIDPAMAGAIPSTKGILL
ncbi:MAG: imidazoleglycerol-phosphate dehydratase HisB [Clostridia bacterium]|nr:imidazoleglycerol-phosphate dehydratase HisB [Clostridia bacterium]